ncbi:hypothetical protein BBJ28_00003669 [Nothophytophthora sp. Chile5]|nr:hypothetical protein BBJ28_00003669 [Nothophytophthora sp. Chile5]
MTSPRYGRDRERPRRRGAPGAKRTNPWLLAAASLFACYCLFLLCWRLWAAPSRFVGSAPTEQISNLRKVSGPIPGQDDGALDVEIAARQQEQQEREERARQIPIKVVLSTPAPQKAETPKTTAEALTDKRAAALDPVKEQGEAKGAGAKAVSGEGVAVQGQAAATAKDLEPHVPVIPAETESVASPVERRNEPEKDAIEEAQATQAAAVAVTHVPKQPKSDAVVATFVPFEQRHQELSGYDATMKFLESYEENPDESLFLLFMCSDEHFHAGDWSTECREGKQHVYDVFAKSPGRNRLVTVLAGSQKYWKHQNDFYNDPDLRVKGVPSLMRWEARNGRTSGMLVQLSLLDDPFLRYLFGNVDQPDLLVAPEVIKDKQIVTVNGYEAYLAAMESFKREKNPVPTFLMMISGRFPNNNRPWCPYCRYSELPLEYAFYAYAPKSARLIRVEVTDSYSEWKHNNLFNRDPDLQLKIVPTLFHIEQIPSVEPNALTKIRYDRHKIRYDELTPLRELFTSYA